MKLFTQSCAALAFAFLLPTVAVAGGGHDHKPKHGGIVVEVKEVDYEVVAKPDLIQVYVRGHDKLTNVDGAKAKVTLLNGKEKTEIELMPVGDRLEAKGNFKIAKGTKGIASVTLAKKTATTVRFEIK